MDLKKITSQLSVAGQILPEELGKIAALGFSVVVNNRPEGEVPGQPSNEELKAAAAAAGLSWHFIPVTMKSMSAEHAGALREILEISDEPVLAFCRSGRRSSILFLRGLLKEKSPQEVVKVAHAAGVDTQGLRDYLELCLQEEPQN